MTLPSCGLVGAVEFLARRFVHLAFHVPTAFLDILNEPHPNSGVTADRESSPDTDAQEFLTGEEYILGVLISYPARLNIGDPRACLHIVRHRSRIYFLGFSHSVARLVTMAAVSRGWLQAVFDEVSGQEQIIVADLERASSEWGLPFRVLCNSPDEYVARFTGRVVRNLLRRRIVVPLGVRSS